MTNKRGQAALEFLSTYGFAFLIILVMVGALTYFGVLNPQGFVPSRCSVSEQFSCDENFIQRGAGALTNASIFVVVRNTRSTSVEFNTAITSMTAVAEGYGSVIVPQVPAGGSTCGWVPAPTAVAPGATVTLGCTMNNGPSGTGAAAFPARGQKIKVAIDFQFRESGNSFWNAARADVINTLQ